MVYIRNLYLFPFTEYTCSPDPQLYFNNTNVTYTDDTLGSTAIQTCTEGYKSNNVSLQNTTLICILENDPNFPSLKIAVWRSHVAEYLACTG